MRRPDRQQQGLLVEPLDLDRKVLEFDPEVSAARSLAQVNQGEIEAAVGEGREKRARVGFAEGDAEARVLAVETREEAGDAALGQRLERGAEPDRAVTPGPEAGHFLRRRLGLEENPARAQGEAGARLGQPAGAGPAFDEHDAELALERSDLLGESRLRDVQPLGRRREAHRVGDREEIAEVAELHTQ